LGTVWDGELEGEEDGDGGGVRVRRNELAGLMGVTRSESCLRGGKKRKKRKKEEELKDVHESYQSLVDTKGF